MRAFPAHTGAALLAATLLAACGRAPAPAAVPSPQATAAVQANETRAWLARVLTCGDREFLRADPELQRANLSHMPGVQCGPAANGTPLRCDVAPPLRIGQVGIGWFVIGTPQFDLAPIILPAPPEALRNAMSADSGALSAGTDLGDTTVQCALTDEALAPGTISGTVLRAGDPASGVRVCAFELAEDAATCTQTRAGERSFRIEQLTRGDYLVFAIPGDAPDARIGYTGCDPSEDEAACTHELKVVQVKAGHPTDGIDPSDLRTLDQAADWPQPPPMQ